MAAYLALFLALGGGSFAVAALSGQEKKVVKKVAKKQANKRITKRAPDLSVAHATTADSASTANSATHADSATSADSATIGGPVAFGLVDCTDSVDCDVIAAESRGLTDSMVVIGSTAGSACFGVPFTFRGAQATVDRGLGDTDQFATYADGDPAAECPPGFEDASILVTSATPANSAFHIEFYK